jgi:hypothetical protein
VPQLEVRTDKRRSKKAPSPAQILLGNRIFDCQCSETTGQISSRREKSSFPQVIFSFLTQTADNKRFSYPQRLAKYLRISAISSKISKLSLVLFPSLRHVRQAFCFELNLRQGLSKKSGENKPSPRPGLRGGMKQKPYEL